MNHEGMNYSLVSREVIADSVEIMARAHALDGLVLIPNCDKVVPGMVMAAARLDLPVAVVSGGPCWRASTRDGGSRTRTSSRRWGPTSGAASAQPTSATSKMLRAPPAAPARDCSPRTL
jgi:dihydroxyacid dehydratase/phosphogluconate dehydratase